MINSKYLVFYDGECGLCDQVVQNLLKQDPEEKFVFAPLQGKTAKTLLRSLPASYKNIDSLILVENYDTPHPEFYLLGKGALRIAWHLGGLWKGIGWLAFLPPFLYDWAYRFIAKHRQEWFPSTKCVIPDAKSKKRFLE